MQNVSHSAFIFGGTDGSRTRVQKPLDITFSVGSHSTEIPAEHAEGQARSLVAFLCMTVTKAKSRFMFTTDLTHGGSRSPHPRYGRLKSRITAYAARATVLLSFIFKFGHFDAIIRRATLIMPQDPCRSHCGPMRSFIVYPIFEILSRWARKSFRILAVRNAELGVAPEFIGRDKGALFENL